MMSRFDLRILQILFFLCSCWSLNIRDDDVRVFFSTKLNPNQQARITGKVPANGTRFGINLRSDYNLNSAILLHLAFYMNSGALVVNYATDGFSPYETTFPYMPIKPEDRFEVVIQCEQDNYKIYINKTYFCSYKHHLSPSITKAIEIRLDVDISGIVVETKCDLSKDC